MQNSTVIVGVFIFVSIRPLDAHHLGLKNKLFQGFFLDGFIISENEMEIAGNFW